MQSIRTHLAASVPHDARESVVHSPNTNPQFSCPSVVQLFKQNVEAVDGHCIIVRGEAEIAAALIPLTEGRRVAKSHAPPSVQELFNFDVGITSAQAGIAETGTLVLDSSVEQNRLVSLVPPVHIAIINASRIYLTLGETLAALQSSEELSPAITFITGPSRTADIELTLAIGVHGPQELYVIVNQD